MDVTDLRVAIFSGNYNYVRDGANQALNRLADYLLRSGAKVRVYSPTVKEPAFEPKGDLVHIPWFPIPGRPEYKFGYAIPPRVRRDLAAFRPNILHVASPEILGHRAVTLAHKWDLPVVASVHTRFETYLRYYGLAFVEPVIEAILRRFYRRCDALVAPSESMAQVLRDQRMNYDVSIWSRGVDRDQFNLGRRSLEWRRERGIGDDEMVVAFLGRIVMEKGLDVFADAIAQAVARGVECRVLVIGDGPARPWFEQHLPANSVFVGQQTGESLAVALASADVFLNPSITEAFGNVTQEAMACGLPVIAAAATGATSLVEDEVTGILVDPEESEQFADAIARYANSPELRRAHGDAGLAFASTRDWDRINSVVLRLYERVIERRERFKARGARFRPR